MTTRRVSMLIDSLERGGAERVLVAVAPELRRRGWDVSVDVLIDRVDATMADTLREGGVPVRILDVHRLRSPRSWRAVDRHIHGGVELVHAQLEFATIMGVSLARRRGVPAITTHHVFSHGARGRAAMRTRVEHAVARRFAASTVAVSGAGRQHLIDDHGYAPERVAVIVNGVDLGRFPVASADRRRESRIELGITDEVPVLMVASVLREAKGIQHLLAAMPLVVERLPGAMLIVVGDGPYGRRLRELVTALDLEGDVRFLGMRDDIDRVLPAADLFVHPTLTDVLPTSVIEAMAVGLPVVASAVGGVPELVHADVTGRLVRPGDELQLVETIVELLGDVEARHRLGAAGARLAAAEFSLDRQVDELDALYTRILDAGG